MRRRKSRSPRFPPPPSPVPVQSCLPCSAALQLSEEEKEEEEEGEEEEEAGSLGFSGIPAPPGFSGVPSPLREAPCCRAWPVCTALLGGCRLLKNAKRPGNPQEVSCSSELSGGHRTLW